MTLIVRIFADFFDFIRVHPSDPRYQRRIVTIQVSCKIFCHEGSKFHKDTKKTFYFLLRAFVPSCLRGFLLR